MFALHFLIYFLIFIAILFFAMLFIKLNISIDGKYQDKKFDGGITIYWIKFIFAIFLSMKDKSNLNVKIKFLQIPIKFNISLKKKAKKKQRVKSKETIDIENEKIDEKNFPYNFITKIQPLYIEKKTRIIFFKNMLLKDVLIIWEKYLQFKLKKLSTNIGFSAPSDTGILSGYLYLLPFINKKENVNLQWDYVNTRYDVIVKMNIIMKLYGILFKLLVIWMKIKKFKKERRNK